MSRYLLITVSMYARPIRVQTKVHFKNLQFEGFKLCFRRSLNSSVFFPLFKQFLETEMTWSQPIIVRECIFKNQNYMFRVTLKVKSGINQIYRQFRNNVNYG